MASKFRKKTKYSLKGKKHFNFPDRVEDTFAIDVSLGEIEIKLGFLIYEGQKLDQYYDIKTKTAGGKEYYFEILPNPKSQNAGLLGSLMLGSIGGMVGGQAHPKFMIRLNMKIKNQ